MKVAHCSVSFVHRPILWNICTALKEISVQIGHYSNSLYNSLHGNLAVVHSDIFYFNHGPNISTASLEFVDSWWRTLQSLLLPAEAERRVYWLSEIWIVRFLTQPFITTPRLTSHVEHRGHQAFAGKKAYKDATQTLLSDITCRVRQLEFQIMELVRSLEYTQRTSTPWRKGTRHCRYN